MENKLKNWICYKCKKEFNKDVLPKVSNMREGFDVCEKCFNKKLNEV